MGFPRMTGVIMPPWKVPGSCYFIGVGDASKNALRYESLITGASSEFSVILVYSSIDGAGISIALYTSNLG